MGKSRDYDNLPATSLAIIIINFNYCALCIAADVDKR